MDEYHDSNTYSKNIGVWNAFKKRASHYICIGITAVSVQCILEPPRRTRYRTERRPAVFPPPQQAGGNVLPSTCGILEMQQPPSGPVTLAAYLDLFWIALLECQTNEAATTMMTSRRSLPQRGLLTPTRWRRSCFLAEGKRVAASLVFAAGTWRMKCSRKRGRPK